MIAAEVMTAEGAAGLAARLGEALRKHWPEYLMEAAGLGLFMVSACLFASLLQHPDSPVRQALPNDFLRRALMGIAMGSTAVAIIYSPWGKQSGAHINPSVTLTFYLLGKIEAVDAFFYAVFQFLGGAAGVMLALGITRAVTHPSVNYAVTMPGAYGEWVAFGAELLISMLLMTAILGASNSPRLARYTGAIAGCLVAGYITFEDPFSGMSMNPARTFGSAVVAWQGKALWIYFLAPPAGMLLAARLRPVLTGSRKVFCAKLHHHNDKRCIFRCGFMEMGG